MSGAGLIAPAMRTGSEPKMPAEKVASERLRNFFLGLTHKSFDQLGLGHGAIAEYVATVLADFSASDHWLPLRDERGRRLTSVVEMLLALTEPSTGRALVSERALRKYLGDYTLFMSGIFRRFVERSGCLDYYLEEGRRSYTKVSSIDANAQAGIPFVRGTWQRIRILLGRSRLYAPMLLRAGPKGRSVRGLLRTCERLDEALAQLTCRPTGRGLAQAGCPDPIPGRTQTPRRHADEKPWRSWLAIWPDSDASTPIRLTRDARDSNSAFAWFAQEPHGAPTKSAKPSRRRLPGSA